MSILQIDQNSDLFVTEKLHVVTMLQINKIEIKSLSKALEHCSLLQIIKFE